MFKIKTEFVDISSLDQSVEPIILGNEETKVEIKPEIILPNTHPTLQVFMDDDKCVEKDNIKIEHEEYIEEQNTIIEYVEFKQEDVKIEYVEEQEDVKIEFEEFVVKQEEINIDNEYDDLANKSFEDDEKSDIPDSVLRHRCTHSQIEKETSKEGVDSSSVKRKNKNLCQIKPNPYYNESDEEDDDEDETYSKKSGSRTKPRRRASLDTKVRCFLINKNKLKRWILKLFYERYPRLLNNNKN